MTKRAGLEGYGLSIVGRVPLPVHANRHNLRYLRVKRDRMGHDLPGLPWHDDEVSWAALASRPAAPGTSRASADQLTMFGLDASDLAAAMPVVTTERGYPPVAADCPARRPKKLQSPRDIPLQ